MGYLFEELGDEKFQKLCQAVLVAAFPDTICFPIGQPDGGRDALGVELAGDPKKELIVYQVKFVRDPSTKDARQFISDVAKSESAKVEELKKRGAKKYYLLTNVLGSGHLDSGSIDKVQAELSNSLSMPSFCWWRDDIEARVNGSSDIKWSFPEILRGSDVLQFLLEGKGDPNSETRMAAVRSYIASQHQDDRKVKFKQAGLHNDLLELFVDLPARARPSEYRKSSGWLERALRSGEHYYYDDLAFGSHQLADQRYVQRRSFALAATTILKQPIAEDSTRVVMEGAPGQGKSTITQYICQVNRIRFLGDPSLSELPAEHAESPVRLPFRVDLRDYASWLQSKNPFSADGGQLPAGAQPGLESFLSAQVANLSGGHDFTVSDFTAITRRSHVIIILDGFDEVADIAVRNRVVDEISKAATRIQANSKSAQMLVTSRPSAFGNSPGFPEADWQHVELDSMAVPHINEYASKWMSARQLTPRERGDFEKVLREKLDQPHMRDLARNPMQLAILLTLIHQRGLSLPDKRTALYSSYMELFFGREAEKSSVVRDHRDLLIDVHQYLAWKLQAAAERGSTSGAISDSDLRSLLTNYLITEGHKTDLVDDLFSGMVERVVALVSRVQGTYEFEVQPLREYFAAKYLYDTAPYSPPGDEKKGTTPERFLALAGNFYWLNVVRFFCGCFDKGELPALSDNLTELARSGPLATIQHPRLLALMLLGDWVFSQQPMAVQRVVSLLFDPAGFRLLTYGDSRVESSARFALPDKCGRQHVFDNGFLALRETTIIESEDAYVEVINQNSTAVEREARWFLEREHAPNDDVWLRRGKALRIFQSMSTSVLEDLYQQFGNKIVPYLAHSSRADFFSCNGAAFGDLMALLREGQGGDTAFSLEKRPSVMEKFAAYIYPSTYRGFFSSGHDAYYVADRLSRLIKMEIHAWPSDGEPNNDVLAMAKAVSRLEPMLNTIRETDWAYKLEPWREVIQIAYETIGPSWAVAKPAIVAAGIRDPKVRGSWSDAAWSTDGEIVDRMRFARLKSGSSSWWKLQLNGAMKGGEVERLTAFVCAITWLTSRAAASLGVELSAIANSLSANSWRLAFSSIMEIENGLGVNKRPDTTHEHLIDKAINLRVVLAFSRRCNNRVDEFIYQNFFNEYEGCDPNILSFIMAIAARHLASEKPDWPKELGLIRRCYLAGGTTNEISLHVAKVPLDMARTICSEAHRYPISLVRPAQRSLASFIGSQAKKIADIADSEGWFS